MPQTPPRDAYADLCESGAFGIPGPAARLPGFAFARGLSAEGMRDARLILDVKKRGQSWRQHLVSPIEDALISARELEIQRVRPEIETVALSLEARDGLGRFVRHCLYRAGGQDAPLDRSVLAGLTHQEWDVLVGSWLDRASQAGEYAGSDREDEVDFDRLPYRALIGAAEMRIAALALTIPTAALIGFLGFKLNLFLGPAEAASSPQRKAPLELVERVLPSRVPR